MTSSATAPVSIPRVVQLIPFLQQYSWGLKNPGCLVHRIVRPSADLVVKHLAEAWMGRHPSGQASVQIDGTVYGLDHCGVDLPFLVKALSIREPLSIQCHPKLADAKRLFRDRQGSKNAYPDEGQKDEVAYAVTPVELLYGFRAADKRDHSFLGHVPEIESLLLNSSKATSTVRQIVDGLVQIDEQRPELIGRTCASMLSRLVQKDAKLRSPWERWFVQLSEQYADGDIGLLLLPLMNIVKLQPGDAIYSPAGVVHAYLSGELLEIMATSDNVIRCGLTPKYRDRLEFLRCATLETANPNDWISQGVHCGNGCIRFQFHGCDKFAFDLLKGRSTHKAIPQLHPMVAVALNARGRFPADDMKIAADSSYLLSPNGHGIDISLFEGELFLFYAPERK